MGRKRIIIKQLEDFKKKVSKDFPLDRLILFGSQATGKTHKWSDVDLVLVSPKFRKLDFEKRGAKMYNYWALDYPVDFLCYTPEEFEKKKAGITVIREAVETGIEI